MTSACRCFGNPVQRYSKKKEPAKNGLLYAEVRSRTQKLRRISAFATQNNAARRSAYLLR